MPNNFGGNSTTQYAKAGYYPDTYEQEAMGALNLEKNQWDDGSVFITEKVQYVMKNVVRQARKNYYGVFDNPTDEVTGEKKTWVPLTEWSVESVVKSVDLDTKDITIMPGTPQAVGITPIIRALIMNQLKNMGFGQMLNDVIRVASRDGTAIVKSWKEKDGHGKWGIKSKIVDRLNFWIDPSADDIQNASAVIERAYMTKAELQKMKDVWANTEFVSFSSNISRTSEMFRADRGAVPFMEVYERWGQIRKSWVTKDSKDADTWIEGHIVASGIGGAQVCHLIRENPRKDGVKPYEECWYRKLDGRWDGRGVGEMLFALQEYENMVINTRKMNNMVLQNGIFLIRKGSGISPDMINSISAGGGIPVTDLNRDIKQLTVADYRQSSYTDEDRINTYADRVTGAYDINRGEVGRASASATATLTRDRHIRDTFALVQEGIGMFVERLIVRQYIPLMKEFMKPNQIIRISGNIDSLQKLDEAIVQFRTNEFVQEFIENTGFYPEQEKVDAFKEKQISIFKKQGKTRFVKYMNNLFDEEIDVEVIVTDERFSKIVAVQQLRDLLVAFSRLPVATKLNTDAILAEILNLMGIRGDFFMEQAQIPALSADATQAGRLMKNAGEMGGMPTEMGAEMAGEGMPQMGAAAPSGMPEGQPGAPPLSTNLNIGANLMDLSQVQ